MRSVTFDRDVDRFRRVGAVEFSELAERKGVLLGRVEVVSRRLHDGLERGLVVRLCGDCRGRWGTRVGTTMEEIEQGERECECVDVIR